MKNLNYLMDHIRYLMFKIILSIILKKHGEKIDKDKNKPSVKTYINKVENRITFKIKKGYSRTFNERDNEITWEY